MKTEIEKLKAGVEKLQQRIAELEKPQELTRETGMPKLNNEHFTILSSGDIQKTALFYTSDFYQLSSFNLLSEAQNELSYTLASRRVRAWAKAVNGNWKSDWRNNDKKKWGIIIGSKSFKIDWCLETNLFIYQICFPTEELATKFLELFRPELEILSNP